MEKDDYDYGISALDVRDVVASWKRTRQVEELLDEIERMLRSMPLVDQYFINLTDLPVSCQKRYIRLRAQHAAASN